MKFRATEWKDGTWMVVYLIAEVRGIQPTIDGQMVDSGAGSQMWSGIRGLSDMSQVEAEFTAELLNAPVWTWAGHRLEDVTGEMLGEYFEHQPRQSGDKHWVPRTVMAWAMVDGKRLVEWFTANQIEDAKAWIMATVARPIVQEADCSAWCAECFMPLNEFGACSSADVGSNCLSLVGGCD